MKTTKIEIGQCYRNKDVVYEVIDVLGDGVLIRNVITKNIHLFWHSILIKWECPFKNWEGDE